MTMRMVACLLAGVFCVLSIQISAQTMEATGGDVLPYTPENLISKVFLGEGVTITDINFNGNPAAVGFFDKGQAAIGINKGIILSTGDASKVVGVGGDSAQDNNDLLQQHESEVDLEKLTNGEPLRNVATYTIKFIPSADTLRFRYVFASEEYPEFVCSPFNDVFGFFISGPGINGGFENNGENIAKIPGTNFPVSINFVNNGQIGVWGIPENCQPPNGSLDYSNLFNNNDNSNFQPVFDGFTKVFTAQAVVQPCVEYTIKLTIADVSDEGYDSGVFLEAKSFGTRDITIISDTQSPDGAIAEGCENGVVKIQLTTPATSERTINYNVFGTAENGVDYTFLPGSVTIPVGSSEVEIAIEAIPDGIIELTESIYIDVEKDACTRDTIALFIRDPRLIPPFINDTVVCANEEVVFDATIENDRTNASFFQSTEVKAITPHNTTIVSEIEVTNVFPPKLAEGIIESVCVDIQHNNPDELDIFLLSPNGDFILLSSDNGASATNYPNTCFTPAATQLISDQTSSLNGEFQPEDDWSILWGKSSESNGTWSLMVMDDKVGSTGLVKGWSISFNPSYQLNYKWLQGSGITCLDCSNITVAPEQTTQYEIEITDNYGCISSDVATVEVINTPAIPNVGCATSTSNSITFSWDKVSDVIGYEVRIDGGNWEQIAPSDTTYQANNLQPNQGYDFEIRAIGTCPGGTAATNCVTFECPVFSTQVDVVKPVSCNGAADAEVLLTTDNQFITFEYIINDVKNETGAFTGLPAGNYLASIMNGGNCKTEIPISIPEPPAILLSAQIEEQITCYGISDGVVSANAVGGTGSLNFVWEDGTQSDTLKNLSIGIYSVEVVDSNGCRTDTTIELVQPEPLLASTNSKNVSCNGTADGNAIILPTGGTTPYAYKWDSGEISDQINNLAGGEYDYTLTDANGCEISDKVIIDENPVLELDLDFVEPSCFGSIDGEVEVLATGGTGSYQYEWSEGQSSSVIENLGAGNYTVVVRDSENCLQTVSIELNQPTEIEVVAAVEPAKCANSKDGRAILAIQGGKPNYAVNWFDGNESMDRDDLEKGSYRVTISDAQNCKSEKEIIIAAPEALTVVADVENVKCFGDSTGQIALNTNGGVGNFSFEWENLQGNTSSVSDLSAGNYKVFIKDENDCLTEFESEITQPNAINSTEVITNVTCFGKRDGKIITNLEGGVGNHAVNWLNETGSLGDSETIEFLVAGTYTLNALDENGCIFSKDIEISQPAELIAFPEVFPITCQSRQDGEIVVEVEGGTSPYQIMMDGTEQSYNHIRSLEVGEYHIQVIDVNNCKFESDAIFIEDDNPLTVNLGKDTVVRYGTLLEIVPKIELLYPIKHYEWSPADETLDCYDCEKVALTAEDQLSLKLRVTDEKGCIAEDVLNIFVENKVNVMVPSAFSPNGDATNDIHNVHGTNGIRVNEYRIYDRWGELLYVEKDFLVNDPSAGWDGVYRSKNMPSGVYVWYVEVEYENGGNETFQGDVTLIR